MNHLAPSFGNSTTLPPDVWFAHVKKQDVGQDIKLLSHANLYYPALVPCPVGCTCSYHTLVRLPNLVKPDHKFLHNYTLLALSWSMSLICINMHIRNYRTDNVVSEYINQHIRIYKHAP
jgi:hypothetical protein